MNLVEFVSGIEKSLKRLNIADGIAPLLMRLYLAPVLIQAGWNKYVSFSSTVDWFGNNEWGLGLPFPAFMAVLAIATEFIGGFLILLGLATRLISIPLMITMLVAACSVHWENGWPAIADSSSWLSNGTLFLNESVMEAPQKLEAARSILMEHGHYNWLTSSGNFVVLNNGIEFAMTYFIMLLSLFFTGGGRYTSVDYFLGKRFLS
ncbi:DoxX family protein [Paraneptunicella aestuarii]|uniref:HvfX family Cu-binding RiPP maturation protein n=1 Tax=Paraneptunicella aestuarii TaxID=2831148 RepID=UPI001E2E3A85|nr:DoxX family protein [Paraneptunicella aestuarii]UAA40446.1 DoxX family protein [Paraneptunicella aestuarii]